MHWCHWTDPNIPGNSTIYLCMYVNLLYAIDCRPLRGALFSLDLIIDATGIHYSTPPENFETTLVAIFDKGIAVTQSIEQLEKVRMYVCKLLYVPLIYPIKCTYVYMIM